MSSFDGLCLGCMNEKGNDSICPVCGYIDGTENPEGCLPAKFLLANRYYLGNVVSQNGGAVAYISWDTYREVPVIVEEYAPLSIANRNPDMTVSVIAGNEYAFNGGLLEFSEINRNIMNSQLPALITVVDVFEENGTIYAVSDYIPGITLEEFLKKNGGVLKWEQARALCLPLIDTVKGMNDIGIIHGGISPETVIIGRDGKLRITNYTVKSLRCAESEIESELYEGFAAAEQYGGEGLHNDTYTDVYGLAATIFRVIIGTVPPVATERLNNSNLTIPAKFAEELPRHVLGALANALQVLPKNRTKDVETFKNELVYGEMPAPVKTKATKTTETQGKNVVQKKKNNSVKYLAISAVCTAVFFVILGLVVYFVLLKPDNEDISDVPSKNQSEVFAPDVGQIGEVDSGAEITAKLFKVPDFTNTYYSSIGDIMVESEKCEDLFEFVIADKEFSDKIARGKVVSQSVKPGTEVEKETKIELVISLGSKEIEMPKLIGMTEDEAKLELLKLGFLYENIKCDEQFDMDAKPSVVIEQSIEHGKMVNTDMSVVFYINSYTGEESSSTGEESSSENGSEE